MSFWRERMVCVTGAGGSVGSRLCSVLRDRGSDVLAIDHSELALYLLTERIGEHDIIPHIADVRDEARLRKLFHTYRPSVLFNCAALKHVPICERDNHECMRTNVGGFLNVCLAARETGVEIVIQISTDKAVDPVNALGRSKLAAEILAATYSSPAMRVAAVRFHNILGSSGSVLKKFLRQIEAGGPVTVTHADMVRTFGSAEEACDKLMICAEHAAGPDGRKLYALDGGYKVRILDLALRLIGENPIEIVYSGIRPGERLEEKLVGRYERSIDIGIDGVMAIEQLDAVQSAGSHQGGPRRHEDQVRVHSAPQA